MSRPTQCEKCGSRIVVRKMPHGDYLCRKCRNTAPQDVEEVRKRYEAIKKIYPGRNLPDFDRLLVLLSDDKKTLEDIAAELNTTTRSLEHLDTKYFSGIVERKSDKCERLKKIRQKARQAFFADKRYAALIERCAAEGISLQPVLVGKGKGLRYSFYTVKLNEKVCKFNRASTFMTTRSGTEYWRWNVAPKQKFDFLILSLPEADEPHFLVIPSSDVTGVKTIYVPRSLSWSGYNNIAPKRDWLKRLDAWHLLKLAA